MENIKKFPRGINSDQVISGASATAPVQRAPGPGLKLPGPKPISNANKGLIHRRKAPSTKHQASSAKLVKHQAASIKPFAARFKRQAASGKLPDPRTTVHGYWRSFRGARTKGLC